ncbi:MAG: hypothetical protein Q8N98_00620, partial [bacterium]|nr:hypothetical protein [bacterium]
PEEYRTLKAEADKLKARGIKGADDLSAIISKAIADATKPISDKLALIEEDRTKLKHEVETATLRDGIARAAKPKGVKYKAIPYVQDKARELFRVVDGKVVAREGVFSQARPTEGLTPDEWFDALAKTDDFLFEPSSGGGAGGSGAGGPAQKHTGPFRTSDGTEVKMDGITVL